MTDNLTPPASAPVAYSITDHITGATYLCYPAEFKHTLDGGYLQSQNVTVIPLYAHPAPRGRVVLTDKYGVVNARGEWGGSTWNKEKAEEVARFCEGWYESPTPHRVMRLALVEADAPEVDRG